MKGHKEEGMKKRRGDYNEKQHAAQISTTEMPFLGFCFCINTKRAR